MSSIESPRTGNNNRSKEFVTKCDNCYRISLLLEAEGRECIKCNLGRMWLDVIDMQGK